MKRMIFLASCLLLSWTCFSWAQQTAVDPKDFGTLVRIVDSHEEDLDTITGVLTGMDQKIDKVDKKVGIVSDTHARQLGNRSLAQAVRLSVVTPAGTFPDIEEVEKMLTPIEKGSMSPKAFETALSAAIKAKGWQPIDGPITLARLEELAKQIEDHEKRIKNLEGYSSQEFKDAVRREAKELLAEILPLGGKKLEEYKEYQGAVNDLAVAMSQNFPIVPDGASTRFLDIRNVFPRTEDGKQARPLMARGEINPEQIKTDAKGVAEEAGKSAAEKVKEDLERQIARKADTTEVNDSLRVLDSKIMVVNAKTDNIGVILAKVATGNKGQRREGLALLSLIYEKHIPGEWREEARENAVGKRLPYQFSNGVSLVTPVEIPEPSMADPIEVDE